MLAVTLATFLGVFIGKRLIKTIQVNVVLLIMVAFGIATGLFQFSPQNKKIILRDYFSSGCRKRL
jgi:hypothetical protein